MNEKEGCECSAAPFYNRISLYVRTQEVFCEPIKRN